MPFDKELFQLIGSGAGIATSIIAIIAFCQFHWIRRSRRRRIEKCLKSGLKKGLTWRTVRGLSIELGIAENEIIDVSHRSGRIVRMPVNDEAGMAVGMLLIWKSAVSTKAAEEAYSVYCEPRMGVTASGLSQYFTATPGKAFSSAE